MSGPRSRYAPKNGFWEKFISAHWGREPFASGPQLPGTMMTPGEAMNGLRTAAAHPDSMRIRMYVDGAQVESGVERLEWIPKPEDRTLTGYSRRLAILARGRPYAVTVNHFAQHNRAVWFRVRDFVSGLYALTGWPVSGTETVLFHGTHSTTPGGVHADKVDTFAFGVQGRKTICAWPPDFFRQAGVPVLQDRAGARPAQFSRAAARLPLRRNGFAYWPRAHWHVGSSSSPGAVTSFSIGVRPGGLDSKIFDLLTRAKDVDRVQARGADLPEEFSDGASGLRKSLASPVSELLLHTYWLRLITAGGCLPAPRTAVSIAQRDVLSPAPNRRWLLAERKDGTRIFAANGHALPLVGARWSSGMADWMANGDARTVEDLLAGLKKKEARRSCLFLLKTLAGSGAVDVRGQRP